MLNETDALSWNKGWIYKVSYKKNTITLNDINIQVKMINKTIINKCRH